MSQDKEEHVHAERLEAIRMAIHSQRCDPQAGNVLVCHGQPYCDIDHGKGFMCCPWCHCINVNDMRTAEQIEADINQIERGH